MLTLFLVLLAIAAGYAVDRYAYNGEFMRLVIAEIDYLRGGRRPAASETDNQPRPTFGRRRS